MLFANTVSARDIQRQYKKIFEKVKRTKKPIVVISDNKPQAAIVSLDMLTEYQRAKDLAVLDRIWSRNTDKNPEKEEKFITSIVDEVRQKLYDRRQKTGRR